MPVGTGRDQPCAGADQNRGEITRESWAKVHPPFKGGPPFPPFHPPLFKGGPPFFKGRWKHVLSNPPLLWVDASTLEGGPPLNKGGSSFIRVDHP